MPNSSAKLHSFALSPFPDAGISHKRPIKYNSSQSVLPIFTWNWRFQKSLSGHITVKRIKISTILHLMLSTDRHGTARERLEKIWTILTGAGSFLIENSSTLAILIKGWKFSARSIEQTSAQNQRSLLYYRHRRPMVTRSSHFTWLFLYIYLLHHISIIRNSPSFS